MAKDETQGLEEKANALLTKEVGVLPAEIEAMQRFLKATRDMLHFYLNEFGLHLVKEQQEELSKLSSKSDVLILKTARLCFETKLLESEAKKSIEAKKAFKADKKTVNSIGAETIEAKAALRELNRRVTEIVEQMKELKKEE